MIYYLYGSTVLWKKKNLIKYYWSFSSQREEEYPYSIELKVTSPIEALCFIMISRKSKDYYRNAEPLIKMIVEDIIDGL